MQDLAVTAAPGFVLEWFEQLQPLPLSDAITDPDAVAIFSADMVVGFCDSGNLASPRIDRLSNGIATLFERAHALGVNDFVLLQDTHDPDALEFEAFPAHCIRGTNESQTIPELRALPFADRFTIVEKNTLTPAIDTTLEGWLNAHQQLGTAIVVGDCTDLCVYQVAIYLRLRANARAIAGFEVIVPADLVDTYDVLPAVPGAMAHDGDFFHQVFLYHMALNGIRVVRALT
jgi:nicotinamidase-related amidase